MAALDQMQDHELLLRQAAEVLGAPVRAVCLGWGMDELLRRCARREHRHGIGTSRVLLRLNRGPHGRELEVGLDVYCLRMDGADLRLAYVQAPYHYTCEASLYCFWAVPEGQLPRIYRFLRRQERGHLRNAPPIMRDEDFQRLTDNTLGFLRRGSQTLQRFGVPQKRGVLLLGSPGNGKTTACRWLYAQCLRRGLDWKTVTAGDFENADGASEIRALFSLDRPGMVLFDDFDAPLRRDADLDDRAAFLTELDGLHAHHGVVYLFTSNARLKEIDRAMRRPGRIDVIFHFPAPTAELRRRFIASWQEEIVLALDVPAVVHQTDGMSFAELEELRKLLVLDFVESGDWNWQGAWSAFQNGRNVSSTRTIGFLSAADTLGDEVDATLSPAAAEANGTV